MIFAALRRALTLAGTCALSLGLLCAQDWKTAESLPSVDLGGLSAAQRTEAFKLLRETGCGCGCNMKVAECRVVDPSCSYSTGLARVLVTSIKEGKSPGDALAAAANSRYAHRPEPKLLEDAVKIPITGAPSAGPEGAPVTVVEFSDFQCPYCAQAAPQVEALLKAFPTQVKIVFKQFPLDNHPQAGIAAAASLAAQKQGKFWEMHDALFANRNNLSRQNLVALASAKGLDVKRFEADLDSSGVQQVIARDLQDGTDAGVEGTPTVFLNGQKFNGPIEVSALKPILDEQLKKAAPHATEGSTAQAAHLK